MSTPIEQWLKKQQTTWNEAKTKGKSYQNVPVGKYSAILTDAQAGMSRNERPQVTWSFTVEDGEYAGEVIKAFDGIDTEQKMEYLATRIQSLGFDPTDIDFANLQDYLDGMVECSLLCEIRLKEGKDKRFINLYIDKAEPQIAPSEGEETAEEPEAEAEAEEPAEETEPEAVSEEEEEAEDDGTVPIAVGHKVEFPYKGEVLTGVVNELLEEKAKIRVNKTLYTIRYENITVLEDQEDE